MTLTMDGHRSGDTFSGPRDGKRLNAQQWAVYHLMKDGQWRTLGQIAIATGYPAPSVSARLRDLRKPRFGGHVVERQHLRDGLWQYRVLPRKDTL